VIGPGLPPLSPEASARVEIRRRITAAIVAAGGRGSYVPGAGQIGAHVYVTHGDFVEVIDLESTTYGAPAVSVSHYAYTEIEIIERMIRHALAFDAFRRANPSLVGLEDWHRAHV
jgi:hypothetical protein